MVNMRANVVSAILKIDRPFRAATVTEMVGCDRRLTYYHLSELCDDRLLEKVGTVYQILNKEGLLDSLVEITEQTSVTKMVPSRTMFYMDGESWNSCAETIVLGRALHDGLSLEARDELAIKIENTIHELKNLKKFLNNAQRTEFSAARKLSGKPLDDMYDTFFIKMLGLTPSIGKREWVNSMKEKIEEQIDD